MTNIARMTAINPQIALWRMKIHDGPRPRKINPLKWVACIKLKQFFYKKIQEYLEEIIWST